MDNESDAVEVISGRNEFQLYMMFLVIVAGITLLLGGPPPGSVEELYPTWVIYIWALGLTVGGTIDLLGVLIRWKDVLTSLYIEIIAMVQLFVAGVVFSAAGFIFAARTPKGSYIGVAFVSVLAIASLWRFIRLYRSATRIRGLRRLRSDLQSLVKGKGTSEPGNA